MKLQKTILAFAAVLAFAVFGSAALAEGAAPTSFPTGGIILWCAVFTAMLGVLWFIHSREGRKPFKEPGGSKWYWVLLILVFAFAARVALSLIFYGHKTDINCFTVWGMRVYENGPAHFYESWCDYPPGYMLVLGAMSGLYKLIGGGAQMNALCVKLPCMIADLAGAYLIYRLARKTMRESAALALMAVVAFTPVIAYVSSAWGQIDQALTLALVIPILLLYSRKPVWAGLVYGLGVIMKPQALMCGPLFAAAYIVYVVSGSPYKAFDPKRGTARLVRAKQDSVGLRIFETALAVVGALALIFLISLPFKGEQGAFWLIEKYYGTATSYEYASVNAYNFWALIGANWTKVDVPFMGLNYGKWGTIFMAIFVMLGIGLYVIAVRRHEKVKGALPMTMAFMLAGIFTFGHYMHERYIFPALMLLMTAYVFYNDWRLLVSYMAYATTMLVNCAAAFYYSKLFEYGLYWDTRIIFWCSLANMFVFCWVAYTTVDLCIRNKPMKAFNGR
ncbi:MAG: glycosyltransferase family 39 protein [Clostridia bacterium]|nr:glycosyltransferase family 39 protein [Clostridia bacterium]